jgi:hypothetical protein
MKTTYSEIVVNVLGFHEDGDWVALALEMDLRGRGATFTEALVDLQELIGMQISFAHFKGQPDMIWKAAEPVWFQRFADIRRERMALLEEAPAKDDEYQIAGMPIPAPHVIAAMKSNYTQADF